MKLKRVVWAAILGFQFEREEVYLERKKKETIYGMIETKKKWKEEKGIQEKEKKIVIKKLNLKFEK